MIRVKQSTFGGPDAPRRERGDCYSACLASILELPLAEVPRFCEVDDDVDRLEWEQSWLAERGLYVAAMVLSDDFLRGAASRFGLAVLSGKSPRGDWRHAVVSLGGRVVHDPHPSSDALEPHVDGDELRAWTMEFLVPFDPTRVRAHTRPDGLLRG